MDKAKVPYDQFLLRDSASNSLQDIGAVIQIRDKLFYPNLSPSSTSDEESVNHDISELEPSRIEQKYLKIAKSFDIWAKSNVEHGHNLFWLKETKPSASSSTRQRRKDFKTKIQGYTHKDTLKALLNNEIYIACRRSLPDIIELPQTIAFRKEATNLFIPVSSPKANGATWGYTRNKQENQREDDNGETITENQKTETLQFEGTLGFRPLPDVSTFLYSTFYYKDTDVEINDINKKNLELCIAKGLTPAEENNDNCGLDDDKRKELTLGVIGQEKTPFWIFKDSKITWGGSGFVDFVNDAEQLQGNLELKISGGSDHFIGGEYSLSASKGIFISLQPKLWTQTSYIFRAGDNKRLQKATEIGTDIYMGFGIGGSASFRWDNITLSASGAYLRIPADTVKDIHLKTFSAQYQFPSIRSTSFLISYEKGTRFNSFNDIDEFRLELGFKY